MNDFYSSQKLNIAQQPEIKWTCELAPNFFLHLPSAPNAFHRWMQEKILGFKWRRK